MRRWRSWSSSLGCGLDAVANVSLAARARLCEVFCGGGKERRLKVTDLVTGRASAKAAVAAVDDSVMLSV